MYILKETDIADNKTPWESTLESRLDAFHQIIHSGKKCILALYDKPEYSTFRYRIHNVAQTLQRSDKWGMVYFFSYELALLPSLLPQCSILLLCRTHWLPQEHQIVLSARALNIPVIFDIDDFVFDPAAIPLLVQAVNVPLSNLPAMNHWIYYTGNIYMSARLADAYTCTNPFLGRLLEQCFHKKYLCIDNSLNLEQLRISEKLSQEKEYAKHDGMFTLGYFSGTPTHVNDFAIIVPHLLRLFERYEKINLLIVGYMELPPQLTLYLNSGRIVRKEFTDFLTLQAIMARVDLNLVPLAENSFTNCKSELKFFEAAIVDVPTCATPIYSYAHAITNGENGFLCQGEEWYKTISCLYENPEKLAKIAKNAKRYVLERYAPPAFLKQVEEVYGSLCEMYSAAAPVPAPDNNDLLGRAYAEQDKMIMEMELFTDESEKDSPSPSGNSVSQGNNPPGSSAEQPIATRDSENIQSSLPITNAFCRKVLKRLAGSGCDVKERNVFSRAAQCWLDNGLAYTIRRIFLGRQSK